MKQLYLFLIIIITISCVEDKKIHDNKIQNLFHDRIEGDIVKIEEYNYVFNLNDLNNKLINFHGKNPESTPIENIKHFLPADDFLTKLEIYVKGEILNSKQTFTYDNKYRIISYTKEFNNINMVNDEERNNGENWFKYFGEYLSYSDQNDSISSKLTTSDMKNINSIIKIYKKIDANKISVNYYDNNKKLLDSSLIELNSKNYPIKEELFLTKTVTYFKYDDDNFVNEQIISKSYEKENEIMSSKIIKKDIHGNWIRKITTIDNKDSKNWYNNSSIHNCIITIRNITYSEWSNIYRK